MTAASSLQPPRFEPGAPLGGPGPALPVEQAESDRRDLALSAVLFVAAMAVGAATLMPWRDFGRRFGPTVQSNGWVSIDGSIARGWVFIGLAVLLAVAGILIASGRVARGRVLASGTAALLVLAAIAEWGLGVGAVRSGPGTGIWVLVAVGLAVIVAVGVLESNPERRRR